MIDSFAQPRGLVGGNIITITTPISWKVIICDTIPGDEGFVLSRWLLEAISVVVLDVVDSSSLSFSFVLSGLDKRARNCPC